MKRVCSEYYACLDSEWHALKIWYIADNLPTLVIGGDSPQSTVLSMVIHRMTGCKETTNLLRRASFGTSNMNVC